MDILIAEVTFMMNTEDRWSYVSALDEELLVGGAIISEWCSLIVRETDIAFVHGANLAAIITAVSGIETYLRSEYGQRRHGRLIELIENAPLQENLKFNLNTLRKYRNRWVHVTESDLDCRVIDLPEQIEQELENMALFAVRLLRKTIYENQWI